MIAAVLVAPGFPINSITMHDGSVWVTSAPEDGKIARLNRQIDQFDAAIFTKPSGFDVLQSGETVIVTDGSGSAAVADVRDSELGSWISGPAGAVFGLGDQTVAVLEPSTGNGWVVAASELPSIDFAETEPNVVAGKGAKMAVGTDGTAHFLSVADDSVQSVAPDGEVRSVGLGTDAPDDAQVTAVGSAAVVLAGETVVVADGEAATGPAPDLGDGPVLQQSGPDSDEVLIAGTSGLAAVALDGLAARPIELPPVAGAPARPVTVAGCVHAAWAGAKPLASRQCGEAKPITRDLPGSLARSLVFRVNRNVVALNDTGGGSVWIMDEAGDVDQVDNWQDFREVDGDDKAEQEQQPREQPAPEATCGNPNSNPVASPDSYGVRRSRPTVMPVTANDKDPDTCDVVVISRVTDLAGTEGTLDVVGAGTALQFTPNPQSTSARVTATYTITDGRGGEASTTVTLRIDERGNEPPKPLKSSQTTVEVGKQVAYNVLADWTDPNGDPLLLTAADSDQATVRWSSDGTITVVQTGEAPGRIRVPFTVSDGSEAAEGLLIVDVQPAGRPIPPVVRGDYANGVVGRALTLNPLDNDTDANGDQLRLAGVSSVAGGGPSASFDASTGSVTWTFDRPGGYVYSYLVSDGSEQVRGTIRLDILPAGQPNAPVAVIDKVQVAPSGPPVVVDVLSNDIDPGGDPLAVVGATAPGESGITVAVVDFARLRITARSLLDAPATVTYRITDGESIVEGTVLVAVIPPSGAADQPPIARPDRASVRAGDVVNIPVLANDTDPEGRAMTLDPVFVEEPGAGLLFVSGDQLRFVAPEAAGNHTAVYQVRDEAGNAATARVAIAVLSADDAANRPPLPRTVVARQVAGSAIDIPIPLAGIDPDGDSAFLVSAETSPLRGTLSPLAPGAASFTYTTAPDASGVDLFRYRVADRFGAEAIGTVSVVVIAREGNLPPVTIDDVVVIRPGRTVNVPVLANDADPDGDALVLEGSFDQATFGSQTITVKSPGSSGGTMNIPYLASDSRGGRTPGLLTLVASDTAPTLAPIAVDDAASEVAPDATSVTVDVLANDSDPDGTPEGLTAVLVDGGDGSVSGGSVTIGLTDRPRLVAYSVTDGDGNVAYALVSVPGLKESRVPVLRPGVVIEATIGETVKVGIDDVVVDPLGSGLSLTESVVATAGAGTAAAIDAKSFEFTPDQDAPGSAKVGIAVRTDDGRTAQIDVPVRINSAENRPPTVLPATIEVPRADGEVRLPLAEYATDPDAGDTLTFGGVNADGPGLSTAQFDGDALVLAADESARLGDASVRYTVSDGKAEVPGTVTVRVVESSRPAPRTAPLSVEAEQGKSVRLEVLAGAYNPLADRGTPLKVVGPVTATAGEASTDGSAITFTPNAIGTSTVTYRIQDGLGRTADGTAIVTVSAPPAAPGAPTIDKVASGEVTLRWAAPQQNGKPIKEYTVEANDGRTTPCGSSPACTVAGLTNGKTYRFRVSATNAVGTSPYSAWSVDAEPDQRPDAPSAPTIGFGDGSLTVTWEPAGNSGSAISGYTVYVVGRAPQPVGASTLSATIDGLVNGQTYDVSVAAVNKAGESEPSPTVQGVPARAPDAPVVQTPTLNEGATGSTLTVKWELPSNGGSALISVTVTPYKGDAPQAVIDVTPELTEATFPVPNDGAAWSFTVEVENKAGKTLSARSTGAEAYATPAAPIVSATAVRNGVQLSISPNRNDANKPITEYLVSGIRIPAVGQRVSRTVSNSELGLRPGVSASLQVQAFNGKTSPATPVAVDPYGNVNPPSASFDSATQNSVVLRWSPGASSGRPVTLSWNGPTGGQNGLPNGSGAATIGGLACSTSYTVNVTATDSEAGPGNVATTAITVRTADCPPSRTVRVTRGGGGLVQVELFNFQPNAPDGFIGCEIFGTNLGDPHYRNVNTDGGGYGNWTSSSNPARYWTGSGSVYVNCDGVNSPSVNW